jgi:hypothetical protein
LHSDGRIFCERCPWREPDPCGDTPEFEANLSALQNIIEQNPEISLVEIEQAAWDLMPNEYFFSVGASQKVASADDPVLAKD